MFTLLLFRNRYYTIVILIWAALISYSRVYLGVHFISDITAGAISGIIIGTIIYKIYQVAERKIAVSYKSNLITKHYPTRRINILTTAIASYMFLVALSGKFIVGYFI